MICQNCYNQGSTCAGCRNHKALDEMKTGESVTDARGAGWYKDGTGTWRTTRSPYFTTTTAQRLATIGFEKGAPQPAVPLHPVKDDIGKGVWATHKSKNLDIERVFETEIEALRNAVSEGHAVTFLPFGMTLEEVLN